MPRIRYPLPMRVTAALLLGVVAAGCTKQVTRPAVETRHYAVDWEHSTAPAVSLEPLTVRGIVLTPAQFPLEGSVKRLLLGDFIGVIDGLDLQFRSGTVPAGVLRDIFDAGFLPVYLRVTNDTQAPQAFLPQRLVVQAEPGRQFDPARPDQLPQHLSRMDWERTAVVTLAALVLVAALAAGRDAKIDPRVAADVADLSAQAIVAPRPLAAGAGTRPVSAQPLPPAEPGMLEAGTLAPGEHREGFVFFAHRGQWVDWSTVKLAAP